MADTLRHVVSLGKVLNTYNKRLSHIHYQDRMPKVLVIFTLRFELLIRPLLRNISDLSIEKKRHLIKEQFNQPLEYKFIEATPHFHSSAGVLRVS